MECDPAFPEPTSLNYSDYPIDPSKEIRLLELERIPLTLRDETTTKFDEILVLQWRFHSVLSFDAPSRPKFAAVSYVWGPENPTSTFFIGWETVEVRQNIWCLLQELPRFLEVNRSLPYLFWIDSICVDQTNAAETNAQLPLYSQIYAEADCVISWLGPSADSSDLAMDYLSSADHNNPGGATSLLKNLYFHSLECLLSRNYWFRVWIAQEILLAKRLWIACGSKMIDGDYLTTFFEHSILSHNGRLRGSSGYDFMKARVEMQGTKPSIQKLLHRFYRLQSTVPEDKIRGFLALCSNPGDLLDDIKAQPNSNEAFRKMVNRTIGLASNIPTSSKRSHSRISAPVTQDDNPSQALSKRKPAFMLPFSAPQLPPVIPPYRARYVEIAALRRTKDEEGHSQYSRRRDTYRVQTSSKSVSADWSPRCPEITACSVTPSPGDPSPLENVLRNAGLDDNRKSIRESMRRRKTQVVAMQKPLSTSILTQLARAAIANIAKKRRRDDAEKERKVKRRKKDEHKNSGRRDQSNELKT